MAHGIHKVAMSIEEAGRCLSAAASECQRSIGNGCTKEDKASIMETYSKVLDLQEKFNRLSEGSM